jgi:hypothetical protein
VTAPGEGKSANSAAPVRWKISDACRSRTSPPPHDPQVAEGVGLAEPVTEITVDAQGLLQDLDRGRVIACQPPHVPDV